jgi:hypothetical protein
MDELTGPEFLAVARALSGVAADHGLLVPSFRSPPRTPGVDRAITRWPSGARVSVRRTGVPTPAAVEAMVEGVLVANRLGAAAATAVRPRLRAAAWAALDPPEPAVAPTEVQPAACAA